tara:strand:- start:3408 stop:4901 length:1494 start_codon:yes stop_codon:yes gene_type:complete
MRILGINALNHDAAVCVIEDGEILFGAHSERYSGKKNDPDLNQEIVDKALSFGEPDKVVWFEKPYLKKTRQLFAGQYSEVFTKQNTPKEYLKQFGIHQKLQYVPHHLSHAAAGYYTSPYDEAVVVVIDAIGEWDCASVWHAKDGKLRKKWRRGYPHSLGLWYSAMTQRLGLKPQEDEYILMGMAGWGTVDEKLKSNIRKDFFNSFQETLVLKDNLHKGCRWWNPKYFPDDGSEKWKFHIAANVQSICEDEIQRIFEIAKREVPQTDNCIYMGGVALNCVANSILAEKYYQNLWIMPNPGDAGSSLGSAAYVYGDKVNFEQCFIGNEIKGKYPIKKVLNELLKGNIVGVANGKAEYGPRALGNRSLLADPRGTHIKDEVNKIKHRQEFRPFAPSVLEEHAHEIFDMPVRKSQFMQFVAYCKYPNKYPAICHVDGTSRVQTVSKEDNPDYYKLIKEFYKETGCPMVLNTSLNIKGQPIVNDENDAKDFEKRYGVKVFTK